MLAIISFLMIGFSVIATPILFVAYVFFLHNINKTAFAIISCALLLTGLSILQLEHLNFLRFGSDPIDSAYYLFCLFLTPASFYFFSRAILLPDSNFRPYLLIHFAPALVVFVLRREVAMPILFSLGLGYCLWFTNIVYGLRKDRQRSHLEIFFFGLFSLIAGVVLILVFSLPYMDHGYFYHFYIHGIGVAFVLIVAALLSFPNLLSELTEAAKLRYSSSSLTGIDTEAAAEKLESLMRKDKIYQNEGLNLASVAELMALSPHQISELINTRFGKSFSRYIREHRIEAAKQLLVNEPDSSVLAISLQTGFKSQSNFYAAFKDITGQSPKAFREK